MNYVSYLKKMKMIGAFDPWKKIDGDPYCALLVAVDIALEECLSWSNQDMGRTEFLAYLKQEDILVFSNVEDFVLWKKNKHKPSEKKKFTRKLSEERKLALKKHAEEMRSKLLPSISQKS